MAKEGKPVVITEERLRELGLGEDEFLGQVEGSGSHWGDYTTMETDYRMARNVADIRLISAAESLGGRYVVMDDGEGEESWTIRLKGRAYREKNSC